LLTAIAFVAIVAGGAYAAVKIAGARKRRQVRRASRHEDHQVRRERGSRETAVAIPPVTSAPAPAPTARHDVEDDLARLRREMGH
jgi:hypothetical protein